MSGINQETALYIHWPFCAAKCPYCDFNSHVAESIDHDAWVGAYTKAIDAYADRMPGRRIVSIYFGGGTPSLMKPGTVQAIIDRVQQKWSVANDIEITLEANPTSVEMEKFKAFRVAGVNRVSLGVQALNDQDLKFLGRQHSAEEAIKALEIANENFERVNFDLIYARPEQSLDEWKEELGRAADLSQGHMSVYQLTIERGTPFYMAHARGEFHVPEQELAADFYTLTQDVLEGRGLPSYEVSNHAAEGQESRHNMMYWSYADYIGIGPGAHGRITIDDVKYATREHAAPDVWMNDRKAVEEPLMPHEQLLEGLMMGLRVKGGVDQERYVEILDVQKVEQALQQGWLENKRGYLYATREGVLRLNALIDFITA